MEYRHFSRLLSIFCLVLAMGCNRKPAGFGDGTYLFVVADKPTWEAVEPGLRTAFERTMNTPMPEVVFEVVWIAPERFTDFATRKNLALVGALDSDGEISQKVSGMLSEKVKDKVMDGSAFVFPKENPWAEDQLLLVLASNSVAELNAKLEENKAYLYNLLNKRLLDETREQMYQTLEQKDFGKDVLEKYGWTLRVQHDYFVNIDRADENFYMLRRSLPGRERWLFVNWVDDADPAQLTEEWLLDRRDKLTVKFYKNEGIPDKINRAEEYLKIEPVDFQGRPALRVEGLWENAHASQGGGGPFRTYGFYDTESSRIYVIDVAVYFPAGKKEPFMRQLDVMAHTFQTRSDISKAQHSEGS